MESQFSVFAECCCSVIIPLMESTDPSKLISVIVPVKNGERFLAQALESILAQTVQPAEILVVVGDSEDNTLGIARSFAQVRVVIQEDQGLANARNLGIAASKGKLIAFLDHDDLWPAGKLELQRDLLVARPGLQYLIGYVAFRGRCDQHGRLNSEWNGRLIGATPGCLMARRELFQVIGGFDPAYHIGTDHDWFARARDRGVATAVIPEILLYKRLHEANLSRDIGIYQREMLRITRESVNRKQTQPAGK